MKLITQQHKIDELFSGVSHLHDTEILELYDNGELAASICIEYIGDICNVHLHIHEYARTTDRIETVIQEIHAHAIPYVKDKGIKTIVATCDVDDEGTLWLMKKTGFSLKTVVIGEISWE
jgi:RimJ/RimL family protein N-acetyltransferase